jgi:hypothetical protein
VRVALFSIYIQNIRLKGVTVALWVRLDLFWNEGVARKVIRSGGLTPRKIPCESSSGGALVEPGNRCDVSCFPRPKSWARKPSRASRLECGKVEIVVAFARPVGVAEIQKMDAVRFATGVVQSYGMGFARRAALYNRCSQNVLRSVQLH